jgi:hypothetical protein
VEVSLIGFKILAHIKGNENLDPSQRLSTFGIRNVLRLDLHGQLIDSRLQMKNYLDSDLLPAHELGMALRQPDTALQ